MKNRGMIYVARVIVIVVLVSCIGLDVFSEEKKCTQADKNHQSSKICATLREVSSVLAHQELSQDVNEKIGSLAVELRKYNLQKDVSKNLKECMSTMITRNMRYNAFCRIQETDGKDIFDEISSSKERSCYNKVVTVGEGIKYQVLMRAYGSFVDVQISTEIRPYENAQQCITFNSPEDRRPDAIDTSLALEAVRSILKEAPILSKTMIRRNLEHPDFSFDKWSSSNN